MPRPNRSFNAGTVYHLIARFVANEWFIKTNFARITYLQLLGNALARTDWRCFGYAVMSNHIHLAMMAGRSKLASWIGDPHSIFAEWINESHHRIGSVFTRGPKAVPFQESGAASLLSYIHRNPVRAGVVAAPGESDWTSHRMYSGETEAPPWLDVDLALRLTGTSDAPKLAQWIDDNVTERETLELYRRRRRRARRPMKPLPAMRAAENRETLATFASASAR